MSISFFLFSSTSRQHLFRNWPFIITFGSTLWIHSLYASRSSGSIFVNDKIIFLFYLFAKKAIRFSFQNLTALLSCCVPKSSIFTCNICTKYCRLFTGYFLTAYALQTVILLAFWRSFQRVPWHINSIFIIVLITPLPFPLL